MARVSNVKREPGPRLPMEKVLSMAISLDNGNPRLLKGHFVIGRSLSSARIYTLARDI